METYHPYTFNGTGDYDGYEDDYVETRPDKRPRENPAEPAGDEDEDKISELFFEAVREYLNTGSVQNLEYARLLRRVYPELRIPEPDEPPPKFGSGSSELTGGPIPGLGTNRHKPVSIKKLKAFVRIPERSVAAVKDVIGTTMREFLDEVGQNIPEFKEAIETDIKCLNNKKESKKCRKHNIQVQVHDIQVQVHDDNDDVDDVDDDDDGDSTCAEKREKKKLSELMNLRATLQRHAPWVIFWNFKEFKDEEYTDVHGPKYDLTIHDSIFAEYVNHLRSNRIISSMKQYHLMSLVTLVLESESDVWMACGGKNTSLACDVWITKKINGKVTCDDRGEDSGSTTNPRKLFEEFKEANTHDDVFKGNFEHVYVGNKTTIEDQLYALNNDSDECMQLEKYFYDWTEKQEQTQITLTKILRLGAGEDKQFTDDVSRHADRLVFLAILDGYVTDNASNARDQLLFKNELPDRRRFIPAETPLPGTPPAATPPPITSTSTAASSAAPPAASTVAAGGADAAADTKIVNYFRKGKQMFIEGLIGNLSYMQGGQHAKLILDMEYRQNFIKLCRANYLLKFLDTDRHVVSDRRKRMMDQERVKRESLYFFQSINGNATVVSSDFYRR